jgi:putative ABC transport system permease protein
MKFFKLLRILILRNIREEKFLTFLSIIGIALGIGLFTGVKTASDRAIASFESDIKGINPFANYEILDVSGIDFHEEIFSNIRGLEENSLPVIKTHGYISAFKDTIDIQGTYLVKAVRFLQSPENTLYSSTYDFEKIYRQFNGILITKKFSEKYSLKKGDILKVLVYDREYALMVADILNSDSIFTNTVIMDIGNYQEHFDKVGYLSRIDLISNEKTATEISKILPANLKIEKKEELFNNQKALVASFRYNLQFISLIAILVGMFLLYNTVFITVVKRRTEIGILRGLGTDKKTVVMLFAVQGLMLGLTGSLLGIFFGQFTAYFSVIAVEKTISTMYSTISISDYLITKHDAIMAIMLGLFVSLLASSVPSFEASRVRPNESSREGSFEGRYIKYQHIVSVTGALCFFSGIIMSYIDYRYAPFDFPILAYTGMLLIIAGFTFFSPIYLSIIIRLIRRPLEKIFRATGEITLGDIKGSVYRYSGALMSVAVSGALIFAFLTLIFSLRDSLKGWIHKNITADIYIKPASCKANYCFYPITEDIIRIIAGYPEVEGIARFRGMNLELFGKKVISGFADVGVKRKFLDRSYTDSEYENILKEMEGDEQVAGISEYLSIKYGLKKGDSIELKSPAGNVPFRINDIFSSLATTSGFVYIDRKWLKKYWGIDDTTQMSIYLKKDANADEFVHKLKERLLPEYSLEIMNNQELRNKVLDIFNKSFAITYAIEVISIIVSLIGVINTLLALVLERRREISIIRYLGGSWKQIRQTLLLSAGILGIAGILMGTVLGTIMTIILINVVNKISFGWEIHLRIPFYYLSGVILILFLTTLFAGFLPSKVAKKIDPQRFVSFE